MVENLKRLREPVAWVVLAVTAAGLVLSVTRLVLSVTTGGIPLVDAFQDAANSAMNLTLVVLVIALVWVCLFIAPATPRSAQLTLTAAWVVTVGTLVTLVATVAGLSASAGVLGVVLEFLGGLLDIILKTLAAITLWLIHRALRAGRMRSATDTETSGQVETAPAPAPEPSPAPTTWRPSEASGSVWRTASEAAEGAPASAHGTPGRAGAWRRVERPQALTGPEDPPTDTQIRAADGESD